MIRLWFDVDGVVYDLSTPWFTAHNKDFPEHDLRIEDVTEWDTAKQCRDNNCTANIYSYFNNPSLWTDGSIITGADIYLKHLSERSDIEIGFLTTTPNAIAASLKIEWLNKHFPYVKNIVIVNRDLKHLISGDILVDD